MHLALLCLVIARNLAGEEWRKPGLVGTLLLMAQKPKQKEISKEQKERLSKFQEDDEQGRSRTRTASQADHGRKKTESMLQSVAKTGSSIVAAFAKRATVAKGTDDKAKERIDRAKAARPKPALRKTKSGKWIPAYQFPKRNPSDVETSEVDATSVAITPSGRSGREDSIHSNDNPHGVRLHRAMSGEV